MARAERRPGRLVGVLVAVAVLEQAALGLVAWHLVRPVVEHRPGAGTERSTPSSPDRSGPAPTTSTLPTLRLADAGGTVAYLQAATAVVRVDVGSGEARTVTTPLSTSFSSLVAGPDWLISKPVDGAGGVAIDGSGGAASLPPALQGPGRLYGAPGATLWSLPEEATAGRRTVARVDRAGHRVGAAGVEVPERLGMPVSDTDGGLLFTAASRTYRADASGVRRVPGGTPLAVGGRSVLTWGCDQRARCTARLTSAGRSPVALPRLRPTLLELFSGRVEDGWAQLGALSPDLARTALPVPDRHGGRSRVVVVDLRSGSARALPGLLTDENPNAQASWSTNGRYLFAVTDGRLRVFDTATSTTHDVTGLPDHLLHVIVPGTPSF